MRFIESILYHEGEYVNLHLHQARVDRVFEKYAPDRKSHSISRILPALEIKGVYKVRIVYDLDTKDPAYDLEYAEYHRRDIQSLEVVSSEKFDYSLKYEDRDRINELTEKSSSDDIIIAINDRITDGSYFNLAFWDGSVWYTPDTPLLRGVRRTQLLAENRIREKSISISDVSSFQKVSLINALMDLGELEVAISNIRL